MKLKKLRKLIKEFDHITEDGIVSSAPANVTGASIAGTTPETVGVPVSVQKKNTKRKLDFPKSPVMSGMFKRKSP